MVGRTSIEVNLDDGRKEYVDYKVYNIIRRGGYLQGRKDGIREFAEWVDSKDLRFHQQGNAELLIEMFEKEKRNV